MTTEQRAVTALRPHPLNASIYEPGRDDGELRRSIAERGVIVPLVVDQHGTILAGHRRWQAAQAVAHDTVPVVVREVADPLEGERLLIESNRQRVKTASEVMREAENLERILGMEAKQRQAEGGKAAGRGRHKEEQQVPATLPEPNRAERETRTRVAKAVGMKPRTFAKVESVYNIAQGKEEKPEPVREAARQAMAALDAGETTPHAAEREVKEAEAREKVRAMPAPPPMADPFADAPDVRAARLVKHARKALKATADYLLHYTPDDMAEAVSATDWDIVSDDLNELARWIADYRKALARRRAGLTVVKR